MDNNVSLKKQFPDSGKVCIMCGCTLSPDEIGLTRKMINRGASQFYCLPCLSVRFEVNEEVLRQKICEFREMGCTLFVR